jgi:DNA-binding transcriptional LysR family regulator
MPSITGALLGVRQFMIVFCERHPLAAMKTVSLDDLAAYPWVFFNRIVHPHLHDLILRQAGARQLVTNVVHHIMQAEQVPALVKGGFSVAWLTPAGAARIAHGELTARPLADEEIRLETHLVTLASNNSALVSEFVRTFMKRYQQERKPVQMVLPMDDGGIEKAG